MFVLLSELLLNSLINTICYIYTQKSRGTRGWIVFVEIFIQSLVINFFFLPAYSQHYSTPVNNFGPSSYIIHHVVKITSHAMISIIIAVFYFNYNNGNISHLIISVLSILCFLINLVTLFYITKWNIKKIKTYREYLKIKLSCFPEKEYNYIFLPFKCCQKKLLKNNSSKDLNEKENELVAIETIVL